MIGRKVVKKSEPFKSKNKINTVKDVIRHPHCEREYDFTFEEDDSSVSTGVCRLGVNDKN
ncbi:hypothetical protein V8V74_12575 [Niallia taxi]